MLREAHTSQFPSRLVQVARAADAVALALLFAPTRLQSIRLGGIVLFFSGVLLIADPIFEENVAEGSSKLSDGLAKRLRLALGGVSVAAGLSMMFWPS